MADKTVISEIGSAPLVTTAGTVAADTVLIVFEEDTNLGVLMHQLERCKIAIIDHYAKL